MQLSLAVLRDAKGGYGSSSATLAVVRALVSSELDGQGPASARERESRTTHVRIRANGVDRELDLAGDGSAIVPLPDATLDVALVTTGPGLVARLERPVLRLWSRPPPPQESPVSIELTWPTEAKSGSTSSIRVVLKHGRNEPAEIDARIPLPPGVTLGAPTSGVGQMQGVLTLRTKVDQTSTIEVPLRFGLSGSMKAAEASARFTRSTSTPAIAPARSILVQ